MATRKTITLIVKIKYLEIGFRSANRNSKMNVIEMNIPVIAKTPAFNPRRSINTIYASSGVSGISKSVNSTFEGSANFEILPDALIMNNTSSIIDTPFAYFFNLGNFLLIPRAIIAPCKRPIPKTMTNV